MIRAHPAAIFIRNGNVLVPIDLHEEWKERHVWQLLEDEALEEEWTWTKLLLFAHNIDELLYWRDEKFLKDVIALIWMDANVQSTAGNPLLGNYGCLFVPMSTHGGTLTTYSFKT